MKGKITYAVAASLFALLLTSCDQGGDRSTPTLDRLSTYDPGPYPTTGHMKGDPYDYRQASGTAVPKKNVALVVDICQLALIDDSTFKPNLASRDVVTSTIRRHYEAKDWREIPGLRPWTHSNFVKSLTTADRERLVDEVVDTMKSGRVSIGDCSK